MLNRTLTSLMATLAIFTLALSLASRVRAQDIVKKEEPTQQLELSYPDDGIVLQGKGDDEVRFKGTIYLKVYPVSPRLKKTLGDGPVYTNEMEPRAWHNDYTINLPLGEYEVHFSMRDGDDLNTCIKRSVMLTTNGSVHLRPDLSGTSKTLVIGGDITFQQMEDALYGMAMEVKDLKAQVAALKAASAK